MQISGPGVCAVWTVKAPFKGQRHAPALRRHSLRDARQTLLSQPSRLRLRAMVLAFPERSLGAALR